MPAALLLAILLLSKITWAYPLGLQDQPDLDVSVDLGVDIGVRGGRSSFVDAIGSPRVIGSFREKPYQLPRRISCL